MREGDTVSSKADRLGTYTLTCEQDECLPFNGRWVYQHENGKYMLYYKQGYWVISKPGLMTKENSFGGWRIKSTAVVPTNISQTPWEYYSTSIGQRREWTIHPTAQMCEVKESPNATTNATTNASVNASPTLQVAPRPGNLRTLSAAAEFFSSNQPTAAEFFSRQPPMSSETPLAPLTPTTVQYPKPTMPKKRKPAESPPESPTVPTVPRLSLEDLADDFIHVDSVDPIGSQGSQGSQEKTPSPEAIIRTPTFPDCPGPSDTALEERRVAIRQLTQELSEQIGLKMEHAFRLGYEAGCKTGLRRA